MRRHAIVLVTWLGCAPLCAAPAATQPAPATQAAPGPIDPALLERLRKINELAARQSKSMTSKFEQWKYTALLSRPLHSAGKVTIRGDTMLWETSQPERSLLLIGPQEVRMYYPDQKTVEVYPVAKGLGELAASPVPRLATLQALFAFQEVPAKEIDPQADAKDVIALRLTPLKPDLSRYISQVRVLLDERGGFVRRAEVTDADGDRNVLAFQHPEASRDSGELKLDVPPGTKITHPLEGLDAAEPAGSRGKSK